MKKSLPLSTHRIISLFIVVAIVAFGTITAQMQQSGAPRLAAPDITAARDVDMTAVLSAEQKGKGEPGEPGQFTNPQTVGAFPRASEPKTFGTCDTAGPIEVEASGGVVGPTAYATLGAAFAAINAGTHTGAITIDVAADTAEGATTAALNASGVGSASYTSIMISPCGGAARTISGAPAAGSPLINLNGADNVTINGLNTGGNSLTISNTTVGTTTGTSTIRFIADASNNLVTNCSILGSSTSTLGTAAGTILFSTGTTTGNDNDTISNCNIGPAGANLPSKAIMASGTSSAIENDAVLITGNNIFDFFIGTTSLSAINIVTGNEAWTISNNKFYQTATRTFTTAASRYAAITLNNSTGGFTVSGNTIGFGAANGTGTTTITGSSNEVRGIDSASVRTTAPATEIQNNIISGINQTSSRASTTTASSPFIAVAMGTTDGLINATGNTIGSLDGSSTIVINETSVTASNAPFLGFYNFSFFATNISSNNIGAITIQSTGTTVGFRGILVNTTTGLAATINNNVIGGTNAAGAITDTQVGSYAMYGIQTALPNLSATGNIIRNMSGASNGAALIISGGILTSGSTGANTISQNTIHSLTNASGAAANSIYGMSLSLPAAANVVERNLIHSTSLTSTVTGTQLWGISAGATGTTTFKNNMIRLGLDAAAASVTLPTSIIGIRDAAGSTNQYFHNSIYVGGTGVLATPTASNSYCFFSDVVTVTRAYQDNIFWNARSNAVGGGVAHLAIRVGGTAPNPAGLTSNFNDLHFTGTDGATGVFNATVVPTLAAWRTATGQDNNSFAFDPQFIAPNGTAATVDLHIHPTNPTPIESSGTLIASVTDDFDGQVRSSLTPVDIGADAGNFVALDISAPGISYTPLTNTGSTSNRTLTATITDATGVASGSLLPRIYFKKSTDGAYVSTQSTMTGGTAQNGTYDCLINYALVGGGSVTAGDTIQYFVVAQDTLGNLSSNPGGGFTGTDVNTVTTPPTTPNSYTIVTTYAGSLNVGAAEAIQSLTNTAGLFEKLNAGTVSGNVIINLTSDLAAETGTVSLNSQVEEGVGNYTITIQASGAARTISGSNTTALINLNGADRVTFSGLAFGGQSLVIRNTSATTGAAIRYMNDASSNSILSCVVEGGNTSTTSGVVFFSTGTTTGNLNNSISDSTIRDRSDAAGVPANLIYSAGTSGVITNKGNSLTNNQLKNFSAVGVTMTSTGNENWTISGNTIFEEAARTTGLTGIAFNALGTNSITLNTIRDLNTSGSVTGMQFGNAFATTVSRNRIFSIPSTSGSTSALNGIRYNGGSGLLTSVTIVNNQISIIPSFTNSQTITGIEDDAFSGNVFNIYFNSVLIGGTASGSATWAYQRKGATPTTTSLLDNIFFNNRTGGSVNHFATGDASANTGAWSSNYNVFVGTGTTAANFMDYGTSSSGTPVSFATWQTGPPARDANSQASNPGVGNYSTVAMFISDTDLHSIPTSPALSTGNATGTGVTTDFDNDLRPASNPDIGADEIVQALAGTIPSGTFYNALTADGDSLGGNVSITNVIYLNGKLSTGANTLAIGCNGTVSGGGVSNYVIGNLKKAYCATGSKSFEVGTANGFSPVTVNITAGTFPADFTTKAVQGAQPNLAVPAKALSRYWTLTATGVTANLTFNYLDPIDIPMTANEAAFVIFKYNGSFSMPGGTVNPGSDNATITGVSSFSDWTLAEPSAEPCPLSTTPTSQNFPGAGGSNSFTVAADGGCVWTPVSNDAFITIDTVSKPTGGHAGNGTVNYSVAANLGAARMGTITIGVLTFTVTQDTGCSYMLDASSHNFNAPGGSSTVGVTATTGCAWTAVSNDAFIIIDSGTPGSGNGTVNYHVTSNTGPARMGTMTIAGFTFTVTQDAACAFMLSSTSAHFINAGGVDSVNVLTGTGCTWTAVSNDAFIIVTMGASGSGNGTVNYSVAANMAPARMGTMTIAGITFTVSQDGGCTFSLSREHQSFPGNGGSGSLNITASDSTCPWTASTAATYIHITSGTPGTGNGTLMYTVDANPGPSIRSATITIAGHTYTVYQGIDFLDVPSNDLFYTDIGKLAARGVTLGCGSGNYCPNDSVLREQMAAFILRAKGEFNPPTPASQRFTDVPPANVFYNFIDRLAVLGITLGCNPPTNDMYCPGSAVTREQMSAFILRGLGEFSPPTPASQRFNDVTPANVFYNFIDRMAVLNITLGCTPDHLFYCPSDPVTRAQMAAFLVRAFDL